MLMSSLRWSQAEFLSSQRLVYNDTVGLCVIRELRYSKIAIVDDVCFALTRSYERSLKHHSRVPSQTPQLRVPSWPFIPHVLPNILHGLLIL